jgi:hypothetical protein
MSVEPEIVSQLRHTKFRNQCFEIYGFDVLVDHNLRPWLLEINVLPSLSSSSPFDKQVKSMLLSDTMHLVGYQVFDRKKITEDIKQSRKDRLTTFQAGRKTDQPDDAGPKQSEVTSPTKKKIEPKQQVPQFLEGISNLNEEDMELLAQYEEESFRKQ